GVAKLLQGRLPVFGMVIVELGPQLGIGRQLVLPARQQISSRVFGRVIRNEGKRGHGGEDRLAPVREHFVIVTLEGDAVRARGSPVEAEAALRSVPVVVHAFARSAAE